MLYNHNLTSSPQAALYFKNNSLIVYFGDYSIEGYELNIEATVSAASPNNFSTYWNISVDSIIVDTTSSPITNGILSISSQNIQVDNSTYKNIWDYYNGKGDCTNNYTFINCTTEKLGLSVKISGKTLDIPATALWVPHGGSYLLLVENSTQVVLGTAFLKNFVTVFNYSSLTATFVSLEEPSSGSIGLSTLLLLVVMVFVGF